jgi:hypothetical protein
LELLDTLLYTVSHVNSPNGSIDGVRFTSSNAAVVSLCSSTTRPCPSGSGSYNDGSAVYNTNATGYVLGGTATIRSGMIMEAYERCFATANVEVVNPGPWWQEKEGDLITNGSIFSDISGGCAAFPSSCDASLILYDSGNYPGVPQSGDSISAGGNGTISEGYGWNSRPVTYGGPLLSYDYFRNKLPETVSPQTISTSPIDQGMLTSGGTEYPSGSGYYYYVYNGDSLVITDGDGNLDIGGRKVIVFAQGNVNIQSKITLTDGVGSFILVAGGDISVSPSVAGPMESTPVPDLEGIYFTEEQFTTGSLGESLDTPLHVRGSVIAWDRVVLERDLVDNSLTPAEYFEFGIDQFMYIPNTLGERNILWREVAP